MSIIITGNKAHDAALLAAEIARNASNVGVTSQVTLRTNDLTYARAALSSTTGNDRIFDSAILSATERNVSNCPTTAGLSLPSDSSGAVLSDAFAAAII